MTDYYKKYIKYKLKYINYKNKLNGGTNNFQGIKCELNHLSIFKISESIADDKSKKDFMDYIMEKTGGKCSNGNYDSYHAITNCPCDKFSKTTLQNNQIPFKFKNSLSDYIQDLFINKKFNLIGSFKANSNKMLVCYGDTNNKYEMDKCPPLNTPKGTYNVYFIDWKDHWNINYVLVQTWEAASLIMHSSIKFTDLDNLLWHKAILYVHGSASVFPLNDYGDIKKLKHPSITNSSLTFNQAIDDIYDKNDYKIKYIMFDNGVSFVFNENRPRPYIYGTNIKGETVAIFLHTMM